MATSVGGAITGDHADIQVADDPLKPMDVTGLMNADGNALAKASEWWDETMSTRLTSVANSARVVVMQRLHEADLAGLLIDQGYELLCLPMKYDPERHYETSLGHVDFRTVEGELLWPERFPEEAVKVQRKELGARGAAAQHDQLPSPPGGELFQRSWIQHWNEYPARKTKIIQSWDCSFKDLKTSDSVAGQVWLVKGGEYYLLDSVADKMGIAATMRAIVAMSAKWPKAKTKLIEDKANGTAVIELLKGSIPGIIAVNPQGGKWVRAQAVAPLWEAGNVHIPNPAVAPWVGDFVEELVKFTGIAGRPDDRVDAMTQALAYLYKKTTKGYRAKLKAMQEARGSL
ncbi:MAG: phage terminase large subunit [Deltaproteobacteria bacterium]|nr:phage terminase large subunit [Deltaproteobacteria bacterium]